MTPQAPAAVGGRRTSSVGPGRPRVCGPAFSAAFRDEVREQPAADEGRVLKRPSPGGQARLTRLAARNTLVLLNLTQSLPSPLLQARALATHDSTPPALAALALALADAQAGGDAAPALTRACAPLGAPAAVRAAPEMPAAVATLLAAAFAEAAGRPTSRAVLGAVRALPPAFQASFGNAAFTGLAARLAALAQGLQAEEEAGAAVSPARAEAALARAGDDLLALLASPTPGRTGLGRAGLDAAVDGFLGPAVLAPLAAALGSLADRPGAGSAWGLPLDAVSAAALLVSRVAGAAACAPPDAGVPGAPAALVAAADALVSVLAVPGLQSPAYGAAAAGAAAAVAALRPPAEAASVAADFVTGLMLGRGGGSLGKVPAPLTDADTETLGARLGALPLPHALAAARGLAGALPSPVLTGQWTPPADGGFAEEDPGDRPPSLLVDGLVIPAVRAAAASTTSSLPPGALPLLASALARLAKEASAASAGLHTALANAESAGQRGGGPKRPLMRRTPSVLTFSEDGGGAAAAAAVAAPGARDDDHASAFAAGLADGLPLGGDLYDTSSSDEEGTGGGPGPGDLARAASEGQGQQPALAVVDPVPTLTLPPALQIAITGALLPRLAASQARDARDAQVALDAALDALDACARRDRLAGAWADVQRAVEGATTPPPASAARRVTPFTSTTMDALTAQVLAMEPWRKGRYPPLRALARRGGATALVRQAPGLLAEVVGAMRDGSAAPSAAAAFAELVQGLAGASLDESGEESVDAATAGRALWVPPVVAALVCTTDEAWRTGVAVHALPPAMLADPACVAPLLAAIEVAVGVEGGGAAAAGNTNARASALVSVLSAARRAGLLPGLAARPGDPPLALPLAALIDAARAADPVLRERALTLAADDGAAARLPGPAELATAAAALDASFRAGDDGSRRTAARLGGRLLRRIHAAACAVVTARAARAAGVTAAASVEEDAAEEAALAAAARFQRWLTAAAVAGLHPGAHYARRFMGARLIAEVADVWCGVGKAARAWRSLPPLGPATLRAGGVVTLAPGASGTPGPASIPFFCPGFFTGATVAALLNCLADPWDRLRGAAADALAALPPPLPGLATPATLGRALAWAAGLVASPRAREADAGARLLTLAHSLYVRRCGWTITISGDGWEPCVEVGGEGQGNNTASPAAALARGLALLDSLTARAEADLAASKADSDGAARRGYACASLRCARALVADLDWRAAREEGGGRGGRRERAALATTAAASLARLLAAAHAAIALTEDSLAAPHAAFAGAEDVVEGGEGGVAFGAAGVGQPATSTTPGAAGTASAAGRSLLRLSAAWRTMTEGLALFETVIVAVPAPGDEDDPDEGGEDVSGGAATTAAPPLSLLPPPSLVAMGEALTRVLIRVKHVGALDTARSALAALGARLLTDTSKAGVKSGKAGTAARPLRAWPDAWRAAWCLAATAPGGGLDDLVRRSGGLPFYMVALMQAGAAVGGAHAAGAALVRACLADVMGLLEGGGALVAAPPPASSAAVDTYAPRVHGFNTLRAVVDDGSLADATAGARTAGLAACLRGLQAPQWAVRNAASLSLASLLRRTVGGPPPPGPDTPPPRSALTAADLFHRLPGLQGVLEAEAVAVTGGSGGAGLESEAARPLHAVLALLGRLRPGGAAAVGGADPLARLRSAVHACASSRLANLRSLAAAALPPLIPAGGGAADMLAWAAGLAAAPGGLPEPPAIGDHNTVAGRLAQLRAVLVAARWSGCGGGGGGGGVGEAGAATAAAAAESACAVVLARVAWLMTPGSPQYPPCPVVRAEALAVAGAALDAAAVFAAPGAPPSAQAAALNTGLVAAARAALAEATARLAAAAAAAAMPAAPPADAALPPPGEPLLLVEAAAALTASARRGGSGPAAGPWPPEDDARAAVGAPDPAARTAALEGLAACLHSVTNATVPPPLTPATPAANAALAAGLAAATPPPWVRTLALSAAAGEARPEPLAAALSLLAALPPPPDPATGGDAVRRAAAAFLVWPACPAVKSAAVRAAGRGVAPIVAAVLAEGAVSPAARAALAAFGAAVDAAAAPTEDETARRAAAHALAHSGLLACLGPPAPADLLPAAARAWLASIGLLQDEDAEVRAVAAGAVTAGGAWPAPPAAAAAGGDGGSAGDTTPRHDSTASAAHPPAATPDAPVLLCAALRLLAVKAGRVASVRAALLAAAFEPTPAAALAAAALAPSGGAPRGASAGAAAAATAAALRLFDPEPANTAAEPGFLAQAAAAAIIAGGCADRAAWAADVAPWADGAAADLAAAVALPDAGEAWPRGALHRPGACVAAMRAAAALTAAARVLCSASSRAEEDEAAAGAAAAASAPTSPASPGAAAPPLTPPAQLPSPASLATVRDVLTAALIVFGLGPDAADALGQAPPCVAAALTAAARGWGGGGGGGVRGEGAAVGVDQSPPPQQPLASPWASGHLPDAAAAVLLEDALFLVRAVPGQVGESA